MRLFTLSGCFNQMDLITIHRSAFAHCVERTEFKTLDPMTAKNFTGAENG